MNELPYSGAYSRRKYSNYSAASKADAGTGAAKAVDYNLSVFPSPSAGGRVIVNRLMDPSPMGSSSATVEYASSGAGRDGNRYRVMAGAANGYRFVKFQTNLDGVGDTDKNPLEFNLRKDTRIIAVFEKTGGGDAQSALRTAKVTWNGTMGRVNGNGLVASASAREGIGTVSATKGSSVTLTASPLSGFRFVKWHGTPVEGETSPTVTFQMNADYAISAEFASDDSVNPGGGGGGGGTTVDVETPVSVRKDNGVVAFVKKWWWALLIVAYLIFKDREGGLR